MRFFCKKLILFVSVSCLFLLVSCTTQINVKLNKDNSIDVVFRGGAGEAFSKMIMSANMEINTENREDFCKNTVIDEVKITKELVKAGFSDVRIIDSTLSNVSLTFTDRERSSYLFTSGILKINKEKLEINTESKKLKKFYESADEQVVSILDLFLAPVFNDEQMSEIEYLEMISAFYGQKTADEIINSMIIINLENIDGSKKVVKIPFTKFFCGISN